VITLYEVPGENISFGRGLAQRAHISAGGRFIVKGFNTRRPLPFAGSTSLSLPVTLLTSAGRDRPPPANQNRHQGPQILENPKPTPPCAD